MWLKFGCVLIFFFWWKVDLEKKYLKKMVYDFLEVYWFVRFKIEKSYIIL